jgi:hypothetical protein
VVRSTASECVVRGLQNARSRVAHQREHLLAGALIAAAYADHYASHDGPIMFCDARACRAAWSAA